MTTEDGLTGPVWLAFKAEMDKTIARNDTYAQLDIINELINALGLAVVATAIGQGWSIPEYMDVVVGKLREAEALVQEVQR